MGKLEFDYDQIDFGRIIKQMISFPFLAMNLYSIIVLGMQEVASWVWVQKKCRNYVIDRWNICSGCALWTSISFPISYGNAINSSQPMLPIHITCLLNDAFYCICKNCKPIFCFCLFLPSYYKLIFCIYYEKHKIDSNRYSNETGGDVVWKKNNLLYCDLRIHSKMQKKHAIANNKRCALADPSEFDWIRQAWLTQFKTSCPINPLIRMQLAFLLFSHA